MTKKLAILRGINVGGKRKILMADLKEMMEKIGLGECKTYIQSGNVFFQSNEGNKQLENQIEKCINTRFGFEAPVIVKDIHELKETINNNPFYKQKEEITKLHLTFLKDKAEEEKIKEITASYNGADQFKIDGKNVFIFCEGKYHESKLTNNFFEKKLKVGATTRNWKTVLKLMELSNSF